VSISAQRNKAAGLLADVGRELPPATHSLNPCFLDGSRSAARPEKPAIDPDTPKGLAHGSLRS
jgi:hypothetical protein